MNFVRRLSLTKKGEKEEASGTAALADAQAAAGSNSGSGKGRLSFSFGGGSSRAGGGSGSGSGAPPLPPSAKSSPAGGAGAGAGAADPNDPDAVVNRSRRSKSVAWVAPPDVNTQDINQVLRARSRSVKDRKDGGRRSVTWGTSPIPVPNENGKS